MGSGTAIGEWGSRLLRTFDEAEWQREVLVVRKEMDRRKSEWSPQHKGYESLLALLGELPKNHKHHLADKKHWALWLRHGCPTTTNSAESVNGHLNADTFGHREFTEKVEIVAKHLVTRYESRNDWCDRALKRNAGKCFPSQDTQDRPWFNRPRMEFYRALHNVAGRDKPVKRRFEPEVWGLLVWPDVHEPIKEARLPVSWKPPEITTRQKLEEPGNQIILTHDSCHTWRTHMGWRISLWIAKKVGDEAWKDVGAQLYDWIQQIGQELKVPEDEQTPPELAGEWHCQCLANLTTWMRQLQPKTRPAPPAVSRGPTAVPQASPGSGNASHSSFPPPVPRERTPLPRQRPSDPAALL
jgi:hypothetical protein